MMIIWWSKHVGVILSILVCDMWNSIFITNKRIVWTILYIGVLMYIPLHWFLPGDDDYYCCKNIGGFMCMDNLQFYCVEFGVYKWL
jgi:hypothetical protein